MSSQESTISKIKKIISKEMEKIKEKSPVNPYIIVGVLVVGVFFTILGYFEKYITAAIGCILPAYWSMKALETLTKEDDTQWLTYWIVYATFHLLDVYFGIFLKFIPFYNLIKLLFLIWCFMPNTLGATFIYQKFLKKILKKYEDKIDKSLDKFLHKGKDVLDKGKQAVKDNQANIANAALKGVGAINEVVNKNE